MSSQAKSKTSAIDLAATKKAAAKELAATELKKKRASKSSNKTDSPPLKNKSNEHNVLTHSIKENGHRPHQNLPVLSRELKSLLCAKFIFLINS
jgi:glucan-binding YG repeat protein